MDMLLFSFLIFLILPGALGWVLGKLFKPASPLMILFLATVAAGLPSLYLFFSSQNSDGISAAASFYVVPILFIAGLLPATFGVTRTYRKDIDS